MGEKLKAKEVQYNHIYYENEVVLLGVDKGLTEEALTILDGLEDKSLQVYNGLAEKILELEDLRDRKVLFDTIDEFQEKSKKDFHGVYWEIVLDFVLFITKREKNPYVLSVELSRAMNNTYPWKSIWNNLNRLKTGKRKEETIRLAELICYYMGITKEIVETGDGTWYTFENKGNRYNLKEIYEYCAPKWDKEQEIILKDMIMTITGLKAGEIYEIPIRIWAKEHLFDEKLKSFIQVLIEQMNKTG